MRLFEQLQQSGCTCVIARDGAVVFESRESGVRPLLALIAEGTDVRGCTAADKVVGKAAALLYVYMGVAAVEAEVMGRAGRDVLQQSGIRVAYHTLAERIQNRRGDDICPMEKAVASLNDPAQALQVLRETAARLRGERRESSPA